MEQNVIYCMMCVCVFVFVYYGCIYDIKLAVFSENGILNYHVHHFVILFYLTHTAYVPGFYRAVVL